MKFCENCGEKIEKGFSFCTRCGHPLKPKKEEKKNDDTKTTFTGLEVKYEMILIYLLPIIGLLAQVIKNKQYNDFVKFNYRQSATLFLVQLVISTVFGMFTIIIPFIAVVYFMLSMVVFVFSIIALINAYDEKEFKIPGIIDLADKIFPNRVEKTFQ